MGVCWKAKQPCALPPAAAPQFCNTREQAAPAGDDPTRPMQALCPGLVHQGQDRRMQPGAEVQGNIY